MAEPCWARRLFCFVWETAASRHWRIGAVTAHCRFHREEWRVAACAAATTACATSRRGSALRFQDRKKFLLKLKSRPTTCSALKRRRSTWKCMQKGSGVREIRAACLCKLLFSISFQFSRTALPGLCCHRAVALRGHAQQHTQRAPRANRLFFFCSRRMRSQRSTPNSMAGSTNASSTCPVSAVMPSTSHRPSPARRPSAAATLGS